MTRRVHPVTSDAVLTSTFGARWGSQHLGIDYGFNGGAGGKPVFAAQGGTVVHAGAASGFGGPDPAGWVVVDHPTEDGSGTTVYGHVVREVEVGQRVEAGQRIARINPNYSTMGSATAPHLHFEVHPWSWRAGSQIDPQPWLAGAGWPGETMTQHENVIFGIDISEHQSDYSLRRVREEGIDFVILRLCDGTYVDKVFKSHLWDAERTDLLISTYWYLRAPSEGTSISQQVDVIDRQLEGRKDLGVWIDVESISQNGSALLSGSDVWEAKRELERRGYHVPGIYSGAWYWGKMIGGEPSMEGLGHLWVSHYGSNSSQSYRELYPGNESSRWLYPLGDRRPDILQYGSRGLVAGRAVDVNAFRGTREELAHIFHPGSAPNPTPKPEPTFMEDLMTTKVPSLINETKSFSPNYSLALIDRATWENRVLLAHLFDALGLDHEKIINDAIAADNARNEVQ